MRDRDGALDTWVRGLLPATPPAILLGVGSTNDLSILRSFTRRRIPTLHLVSQRLVGSFSRFGGRVRMPPVQDEPEAWLQALERLSFVLPAPAVLFPLMDEHVELVARNAERLSGGMLRFIGPDAETLGMIIDKRRQYTTAQAAGARIPKTWYPEDAAALASLASGLAYPVILKPHTSYVGRPTIGNRKVLVVDDADALVAAFASCTASGVRFMIQEIVPGGDDAIFWYSGFWDEHGERAWFTVQKLRQFPTGFGDGCLQRTIEAPVVAEESRRLLAAFRYRGLVMVELKRDPTDGAYVLMEINPRTVSGNQVGITAGVDLAWIAYRRLIGAADPAHAPSFRPDVRFVNEEWDVLAFVEARAARQLTFATWVRSLIGTRAWGVFAWDDPGPLVVGLWRMVMRVLRGRAQVPPAAHPTSSAVPRS